MRIKNFLTKMTNFFFSGISFLSSFREKKRKGQAERGERERNQEEREKAVLKERAGKE